MTFQKETYHDGLLVPGADCHNAPALVRCTHVRLGNESKVLENSFFSLTQLNAQKSRLSPIRQASCVWHCQSNLETSVHPGGLDTTRIGHYSAINLRSLCGAPRNPLPRCRVGRSSGSKLAPEIVAPRRLHEAQLHELHEAFSFSLPYSLSGSLLR